MLLVFFSRSLRFLVYTALFVPAFLVGGLFRPAFRPQLLRWYLQSMGASFVKLGQFLATRYDLLPPAYCEELSGLLDSLPPYPTGPIRAVIARDLGRPVRACFASFEETPLASASVAQVHGAVLHTGERVVVKVLRPGIKEKFRVDFLYFRLLAWLWDRLKISSQIEMREVLRALQLLSQEEMDFRREARTIHQMHTLFLSDDIDHYAPRVYFSLCGREVITMERIEGVPVPRLIEAIEERDKILLVEWKAEGIDPSRTARVLLRSLLEQTYRHRTFHVDPHAGNLIVMPGGTLAWLDFGMIGWLDERIWAQQFKLRASVSSGKLHSAYQNMIATLEPLPPGRDLSRFEMEIKGYLRDWVNASQDPHASLAEKSSGYFLLRSFDAIRKAGLTLPFNVLRLYRSLIIGDMVMLKLDGQIDWVSGIRDFVEEESQRQLGQIVREAFDLPNVAAALRASLAAPQAMLEVVDWVQERLPEMGRTYQDQLSRIERSMLLGIRYVRTVVFFGFVAVLGSRLLAPEFFPGSGWEAWGERLGTYWWPAVIVGGATTLFLERLIGVFQRS